MYSPTQSDYNPLSNIFTFFFFFLTYLLNTIYLFFNSSSSHRFPPSYFTYIIIIISLKIIIKKKVYKEMKLEVEIEIVLFLIHFLPSSSYCLSRSPYTYVYYTQSVSSNMLLWLLLLLFSTS